MRQVTLTVGKPTSAQVAQAYRTACEYAVPNRAKSTTATVKVGKGKVTIARTTAVRMAVLLAIATGKSVEITNLFTTTGEDYAGNRADLYHLAHRAVSQVERDHKATMTVTAFLAGTTTDRKGQVAGIASTKGETDRVFITAN
jgi:hypothetical protein